MKTLRYKMIPEGEIGGFLIPLTILFVDEKEIAALGLSNREALLLLAKTVDGPAGINIFDMDAVTTTSDGIMIEGAIKTMAAVDNKKIHPEFGCLDMAEIEYSGQIVEEEPHLKQWGRNFPGKKLYRGPDPKTKIIPVHNTAITGRASNNNSATEMMNIVTMEEILLPILGQLELMRGGCVLLGKTGEVISVGIGMTVAEKFGRVFPTRQFRAGDTAHGCGEYAKTLKRDIPCIVAEKRSLAKAIAAALEAGCVPGHDIGCSPAVLCVAKALGFEIALDNITKPAYEELECVGITREFLTNPAPVLTKSEVLDRAHNIIPGAEGAKEYKACEVMTEMELFV